MSESDKTAVDAALKANPLAIAEAEGHLKKGLLILHVSNPAKALKVLNS